MARANHYQMLVCSQATNSTSSAQRSPLRYEVKFDIEVGSAKGVCRRSIMSVSRLFSASLSTEAPRICEL